MQFCRETQNKIIKIIELDAIIAKKSQEIDEGADYLSTIEQIEHLEFRRDVIRATFPTKKQIDVSKFENKTLSRMENEFYYAVIYSTRINKTYNQKRAANVLR